VPRALKALAIAFACLTMQAGLPALVQTLTDEDIARALAIANGPEPSRSRYHAAYIVAVNHPTVEQLEVVTEFRRFVLAAEEHVRAGNWTVARGGYDREGRTMKEILRPSSGQLSIRARLRFHPQNVYVYLPPLDVLLGDPTLRPLDTSRSSDFTPAAKNDPSSKPVIVGATIETAFDASAAGSRVLPIRIISEGKELIRVRVDFSTLD
jgi:hypothetical protein